MKSKLTVLSFVDYYLPGFKFGGPTRVLANTVEHLGEEFDFRIVTTDRDAGEAHPYAGIAVDSWVNVGYSEVCYLPREMITYAKLRSMITAAKPDIIYLNSFFSPIFTIRPMILRRLGLIPNVPVIVAPRGEFSPGALESKLSRRSCLLPWRDFLVCIQT